MKKGKRRAPLPSLALSLLGLGPLCLDIEILWILLKNQRLSFGYCLDITDIAQEIGKPLYAYPWFPRFVIFRRHKKPAGAGVRFFDKGFFPSVEPLSQHAASVIFFPPLVKGFPRIIF